MEVKAGTADVAVIDAVMAYASVGRHQLQRFDRCGRY